VSRVRRSYTPTDTSGEPFFTAPTNTSRAPELREVLVSWAHDPNLGTDSELWRDQVLDLATGLRSRGVPADLDLFHGTDPAVDWTRWGPAAAKRADVIIVAINQAWSQRWAGTNLPTVGAGAVAEADVLHGIFARDQSEFQRRVVIVLLPGASKKDIPPDLQRLVHYEVDPADLGTLDDLLRRLTGQHEYPLPPLGPLPVLPPRAATPTTSGDTHRAGQEAPTPNDSGDAAAARSVTYTRTASDSVPAPVAAVAAGTSSVVAALSGGREALEDRAAVLRSAVRRLPPAPAQESDEAQGAGEQQQVHRELAEVQARLAALESAGAGDRVQELLAQLRRNTAGPVGWLLVVALPLPGPPPGLASKAERLTVDAVRADLRRWHERTAPVPDLDLTTTGHRDAGKVVFTGRPAGQPAPDQLSTRWRIELSDDGAFALAGALPDPAEERGGTVGFAGQPGEVLLDANLVLPVRRDALELWLLTAVHLLAQRLQSLPGGTEVALAAQLAVLGVDQGALGRGARSRELLLVDSPRHPDHPDDLPAQVLRSRTLPLNDLPTVQLRLQASYLNEAPGRVRAARDLAQQILDRFGVEDTAVLLDGTVQPRAAAVHHQQLLYQHARLHGLPVDDLSPADRLEQASRLRADADELLQPPR
jgi:hypothetical protein